MREILKKRRQSITEEDAMRASVDASNLMLHLLEKLDNKSNCKHIGIYQNVNGELATQILIKSLLNMDKLLYIPVIKGQNMTFHPYTHTTKLVLNRYKILEPELNSSSISISALKLDLIIMPLVGFDQKGRRIGMGGGFYDRFLEHKTNKQILVGFAYDCQELDDIKPNPWDVDLNYIVTPSRIIKA